MSARTILLGVALLASPLRAAATTPAPNVVTDWSAIVQQSIHNATAPRSAGTSEILHATVMLAVYDAVIAIEGGYRPYVMTTTPVPYADVRAAAATAAYRTARSRVAASQVAFLDQQYTLYMAAIPDAVAMPSSVPSSLQSFSMNSFVLGFEYRL